MSVRERPEPPRPVRRTRPRRSRGATSGAPCPIHSDCSAPRFCLPRGSPEATGEPVLHRELARSCRWLRWRATTRLRAPRARRPLITRVSTVSSASGRADRVRGAPGWSRTPRRRGRPSRPARPRPRERTPRPHRSAMPLGRDHGHVHRIDDLRDQGEGPDERLLGRAQERHPMPAGLRPGRDHGIHSRCGERDRLGLGGRRADDPGYRDGAPLGPHRRTAPRTPRSAPRARSPRSRRAAPPGLGV